MTLDPEDTAARPPTNPEGVRFVARRPGGVRVAADPAAYDPAAYDPGADDPATPTTAQRSRVLVGTEPGDFGFLASLVVDAGVTDIFVNGPDGTWVDRGAGLVRVPFPTPAESGLRDLAVHLVALGGRHIDETSPCIDTRLGDGIRVHVIIRKQQLLRTPDWGHDLGSRGLPSR